MSFHSQSIMSLTAASSSPRGGGGAVTERLASHNSMSTPTATAASSESNSCNNIFDAGEMVVDDPSTVRYGDLLGRPETRILSLSRWGWASSLTPTVLRMIESCVVGRNTTLYSGFISHLIIFVVVFQQNRGPLKVLFLSADTGGGHRASAESLAKQFEMHFPGSTYDLLDVWTKDGCLPYRTLVDSYKHLSAHPRQWQFLYHFSNSRPWEVLMDVHSQYTCERKIRRTMESYDPDVVISVHPAMNNVPMISTRKLSAKKGKHIPFFT